MAKRHYCPQCLSYGDPQADYCTACGTKLVPLMRIVIMPFVESGQVPDYPEEFRSLVLRDGEIPPEMAVGCQIHMQSGAEEYRLIVTQKESYFREAVHMLPQMVKGFLEPLVFYEIPDPLEVERVTEEAADIPTELFVIIQNQYDPEYLFLPEIDCFFFRYPSLHTLGTGSDAGFGFVQLSAFLLDNRENRIVSRGTGAGLSHFEAPGWVVDENFNIPSDEQMKVMRRAGTQAVESLLRSMKMIK